MVAEIFEIYNADPTQQYQAWTGTETDIEDYLESIKSKINGYNPKYDWKKNLKIFGLSYRVPIEIDEAETTGSIDVSAFAVDVANAGKKFVRDAGVFRAKSLQEKMNISPYFIKCSPQILNLPSLKGYVKDASGNHKEVYGKKLTNAALNFVHNSPKLYYTVGCIASVLTKHGPTPSKPMRP